MKKNIRLTESDLIRLVKKIIKEQNGRTFGDRSFETLTPDSTIKGGNYGRVGFNQQAFNQSRAGQQQEKNLYKPESTAPEVKIATKRMDIYPKDKCVGQHLVTPYIGKGITDETDVTTKTLRDTYGKNIKNAVYYVWNGGGVFRPTGTEQPHLVNVCAGRGANGQSNLGLGPYIQGMGINNVKNP